MSSSDSDIDPVVVDAAQIEPTHFVGIGASAGGLEALEQLFKHMPVDSGMAFIVVQHLSPDYKSMMVELLVRHTTMDVIQIEDNMLVRPNCIYLIPPNKNLSIYHSRMILTDRNRDSWLHLPIDIFFRSLAIDQMKKAIGIILSGTGSDGTLGIKAIKEQGGMIMVQEIEDAKFDGMPKNAIATGLVDYILRAEDISDALIKYIRHPHVLHGEKNEGEQEVSDYIKILSLLRTNVNIDFSDYKPKTIVRRIEHRISVNQLQSYAEYLNLLLNSTAECNALAREFMIGVTQFFRDLEAFTELKNKVIPHIFEGRNLITPIRIWSVGCSTGEEAYSLAILCREYMDQNNIEADLKVFATDLDKESIQLAGQGVYPDSIVVDVNQDLLKKYFHRKDGAFQVNEEIRQMVIFAQHNITCDPPFSKIKLVVCRNLLIYLKPEMQKKIIQLFQYSLSPSGFLFLGSSESISEVSNSFTSIHSKSRLFQYTGESSSHNMMDLMNRPFKSRLNQAAALEREERENSKSDSMAWLYEKIVNYLAPPGVILDQNNKVIHYFRGVKRYLDFPDGKSSHNLMDLVNSQLSMVLSNLIHKARKNKSEATLNRFKFQDGDRIQYVNLYARVLQVNKPRAEYILVTIQEAQSTPEITEDKSAENYNFNEAASERLREMERELQYRDESLQTTVEELETSNEELQATNEEMVSSNEELQSTNEELQSVNEELYTVNSQYQEKINELTELNTDVTNLLRNTKIGSLFLDSQLVIRKFTPEISHTMNIMDVDVGRPFTHIAYNCDYNDFLADVQDVINNLSEKEVEVRSSNGHWYLMRLQPYRHYDNSIHGVLITQVNITSLQNVRQRNSILGQMVEQNAMGLVITDTHGNIEYSNQKFTEISGYSVEELAGQNLNLLKSDSHHSEVYRELWDTIKAGRTWKGILHNRKKSGELYWERNVIHPIRD